MSTSLGLGLSLCGARALSPVAAKLARMVFAHVLSALDLEILPRSEMRFR